MSYWRPSLIILFSLLVLANATVTTYDYNNDVSGRIQKLSLTYTASIHWGNMTIQSNPLLAQTKRVYYQIDTSDIPTNAVIDLVEMNYQVAASQPTTPCLSTETYIGSWIGTSLDGSAADFNGGNELFNDIFVYGPNNWFDMGLGGVDPAPYVNKGGTTDIRVDCVQSDNLNRQYIFENIRAKTQFRITWHEAPPTPTPPPVPQRATKTGWRKEEEEDDPIKPTYALGWVFLTLPVIGLILLGRNQRAQ